MGEKEPSLEQVVYVENMRKTLDELKNMLALNENFAIIDLKNWIEDKEMDLLINY